MAKRTINKSAFVREMGDMPAADIVKKARQRGFHLSVAYVYNIKGAANRKAAQSGASAGGPARRGRGRPAAGGGLRVSIDRLASRFVDEIMRAVRGAPLDDILHL